MSLSLIHIYPNEDGFSPMEVEGTVYTDKKAAGSAILAACKAMTSPEPVPLGQYRGFSMDLSFASLTREFKVTLKGALYYTKMCIRDRVPLMHIFSQTLSLLYTDLI